MGNGQILSKQTMIVLLGELRYVVYYGKFQYYAHSNKYYDEQKQQVY